MKLNSVVIALAFVGSASAIAGSNSKPVVIHVEADEPAVLTPDQARKSGFDTSPYSPAWRASAEAALATVNGGNGKVTPICDRPWLTHHPLKDGETVKVQTFQVSDTSCAKKPTNGIDGRPDGGFQVECNTHVSADCAFYPAPVGRKKSEQSTAAALDSGGREPGASNAAM